MHDTTPTATGRDTARRAAASVRRGAEWIADAVVRLLRQGNRRRLTLRGKGGEVWLRLPLTLAALIVLVAAVNWLGVVVLLVVVAFAVGAQVSVERLTNDGRDAGAGATPPSAA